MMSYVDNKYISRLPHWLRWLSLPIVVFLAWVIATAAIGIFLWFTRLFLGGPIESWLNWLHYFVAQPGGASYLTVIAGVYCAPRHHFIVALILGAIFAMLNGMSIVIMSETGFDAGLLVAFISGVAGAGLAIVHVKDQDR